MRFVAELARALGRDVAELLLDPEAETQPSTAGTSDEIQPGDVEKIGALLATTGGQLHIDIAAQALGWTRPRTLVALYHLEEQLRPVGQRLAWLGELSVSLAAAPVPEDVPTKIAKRDVATFGLKSDQARMIHQLITTGVPARIGDWDARYRQYLVRAGLLELDMTSPTSSVLAITLSDEARYALALDE